MNKVILMGRLTRDPETRYSQNSQQTAICRYTLAVDRSYKREGEQNADFINILSFGKAAEFANKYFRKGMMVAVVGELQISSYKDRDGNQRWSTDVVASEQHFAESKNTAKTQQNSEKQQKPYENRQKSFDTLTDEPDPFSEQESIEDVDLPF